MGVATAQLDQFTDVMEVVGSASRPIVTGTMLPAVSAIVNEFTVSDRCESTVTLGANP